MKDNTKPRNIPEALSPFENSEKTAVICGCETLSYKEIIVDAKKVARALIARGINKGDRVVIDMSRTLDYMRIYLGIIFAGGIAVTIHSGWPEQQRNHVISDCSPVLIANDKTAKELLSAQLSIEGSNQSLPEIKGEDPFQIVYTSGSTGIPKGAVNSHQNIIDWFMYKKDFDNIDPALKYFVDKCQCILLDANLAFVASTFHIFYALMNEKMIAFATDDELKTPKRLAECIRCTNADSILGMTSRYYQYLEEPDFADAISRLRLIILGGELSNLKVFDTFLKISDATLYEAYGMSEICCVYTTLIRKGEEVLFSPLDNPNPIYVLEQEGFDNVPPGSVGEMCIGGFSGKLGRYWNSPEINAKKYVEHPKYGRIFHTGDMARLEPDGRIRILGRLDGMVKLHGQRIELAAIERAMEAFSGIHRAAVRIQGEGSEAILCGYYSGRVDEGSLRRAMAESLPYYMVPALLRELPELPLNINGKTDRRALPLVQYKTGQYAPPQTETEKILCEIFANVLKLQKPVGIDDSFFELGGDSIRGMVVSSQMRERGFEMKMEWLFAVPTVRALASMLQPLKTEENTDETLWSSELTDVEKEKINAVVGLGNVEAVYFLWGESKILAQSKDPWWVFEPFLINGDYSVDELRHRLAQSVHCHQAMRSVFINQDDARPLQVVLKNWEIPIFTVDLRSLALSDENIGKISDAQLRYLNNLKQLYEVKPFTSSKVMFEAGLIKISKNRSVLVLVYSHLLLDGMGKYKIWNELLGESAAVSDVNQYNRYMRHILSDSYKKDSRHIWKKALAGHSHLTEIQPASGSETGRCIKSFIAGKQFMDKAASFCQDKHITISALSCFALGKVLMDLYGSYEAGFLSMSSGRDVKDQELTGMFSMGIPVYIQKGDTPETVQEQIVCAMSRPLPDLDELGLERHDSRNHIFLSIQNYVKPQISKKFEMLTNYIMTSRSNVAKQAPKVSRPLSIFLFPEPVFSFAVFYDGQLINADFVQKLGGNLLTQLRSLVE